jgi:antitoxin (DNA-binding transcriptional repressor) of toxin-antitoxin stability system
MTRRCSIAEARSSLPAIINQAEPRLDVELTRRGRPVVVVNSLREAIAFRLREPRVVRQGHHALSPSTSLGAP